MKFKLLISQQDAILLSMHQKGFAPLIVILGTLVILGIVGGGYYLGKTRVPKSQPPNLLTTSQTPKPTITSQPVPIESTDTSSISDSDTKKIQKKLENDTKSYIEVINQSPTNKNLFAYAAALKDYSVFGIYLYNNTSNQSTTLWKVAKSLVGRGAFYKDNLDLQFSPDGKSLFFNKTGTNLPSLMVLKIDGTIIYQSDSDLGHPTWLNNSSLLFLKSDTTAPFVFDINTKQTNTSNLPTNIYGLKSNSSGSRVLSYIPNPQPIDGCPTMDLLVFSYPEGIKIITIKNVWKGILATSWDDQSLNAYWVSDNTLAYREITGCKDQDIYPVPLYSDFKQKQLP